MKKCFKMMLILAMSLAVIVAGGIMASADNSSDYKVMLNGDYVKFTDANPANVDGRIMVPFRAMLEALGAEVNWDNATKTVAASTDTTDISFQIGKADIKIVKDDKESTKTMDVVPYIDKATGRTYVSTRFMAESFDYTVGWDKAEKAAVIIDYDKIFAGADKDFTIIDKYMQANKVEAGVTYESTLKGIIGLALYDKVFDKASTAGKTYDLKIDMGGSAVSKDNEMSMDITMKMNILDFLKSLPMESGEAGMTAAQMEATAAMFDEITMSIYCDIKTGDCFFTTNINAMMDEKADDKTWFKMNIFDLYENMGIDIKSLIKGSINGEYDSMTKVLDLIGEETASMMTVSTYKDMQSVYALMKAMVGDSALKASTSGGVTTYTSDFKDAFAALGAGAEDVQGLTGKLIMTEKGGTYSFAIQLGLEVPDMMKLTMDFDTATAKTSKTVKAVPADAKIIEIDMSSLEIPEIPTEASADTTTK